MIEKPEQKETKNDKIDKIESDVSEIKESVNEMADSSDETTEKSSTKEDEKDEKSFLDKHFRPKKKRRGGRRSRDYGNVKSFTSTGASLYELREKIKDKMPELSDEDAEKKAQDYIDAKKTMVHGRKGFAGKAQSIAMAALFGKAGPAVSKLFRSKKDMSEASKVISGFNKDILSDDTKSKSSAEQGVGSKELLERVEKVEKTVDESKDIVRSFSERAEKFETGTSGALQNIAEVVQSIKDAISPKDYTVGKGEDKQTYRYSPLAPEGRQVKVVNEKGNATIDASKKGGATSAYERVLSKASSEIAKGAERVPEHKVDEEIKSAKVAMATPKASTGLSSEALDTIDKVSDKVNEIYDMLKDMEKKREQSDKEIKTEESAEAKEKKAEKILKEKEGLGKMSEKMDEMKHPFEKESKMRKMWEKISGKTTAAEGEGLAGAAGGVAKKTVGRVTAAIGGGLAIAAVGGHFINKGLKALHFQDALDSGRLEAAGKRATETNTVESSQARIADKLKGTGYTPLGKGMFKSPDGKVVKRNELPQDVQSKLLGGVMKTDAEVAADKKQADADAKISKTKKTFNAPSHTAEPVSKAAPSAEVQKPEPTDMGEKVTYNKPDNSDEPTKTVIIQKEKPVIINQGSGKSGGKGSGVIVTRNQDPSIQTYTASIFDHPVVHPGLYKM